MGRSKKGRCITLHSISHFFYFSFFCHFGTFFVKFDFRTSKFEFLRSKSAWGQILVQIRQNVDGLVRIVLILIIFLTNGQMQVFDGSPSLPSPIYSECVICTRVEIATKENCLMGISIQTSMTKIYPS